MPPAQVIAGRFEMAGMVGSGGMGVVHRARDLQTGRWVAVKLLREDRPPSLREQERFGREAALLASLSHPGIVRYLAHGITPGGQRYLATEWLEGRTLFQRLCAGPLGVAEGLALARQAAEALGEVHRLGMVHRDIKPSNLVLAGSPFPSVKLIDFGSARRRDSSALTRTGAVLGSPGYMAPEQTLGQRDLGPPADVFALGCVLFECLTGRHAFTGQHTMEIVARVLLDEPPPLLRAARGVPPALASLVERMLAKSPDLRPKDGAEVAAALATLSPAHGAISHGRSIRVA